VGRAAQEVHLHGASVEGDRRGKLAIVEAAINWMRCEQVHQVIWVVKVLLLLLPSPILLLFVV
jgi:hypothetical protein